MGEWNIPGRWRLGELWSPYKPAIQANWRQCSSVARCKRLLVGYWQNMRPKTLGNSTFRIISTFSGSATPARSWQLDHDWLDKRRHLQLSEFNSDLNWLWLVNFSVLYNCRRHCIYNSKIPIHCDHCNCNWSLWIGWVGEFNSNISWLWLVIFF